MLLRWTAAAKASYQRKLNHWLLTFFGGYKTTIEPSAWYDITHTWTKNFSLFVTFITRASPDPSTTLYFLRLHPCNTSVTSSTLCARTVNGSFDWNPYKKIYKRQVRSSPFIRGTDIWKDSVVNLLYAKSELRSIFAFAAGDLRACQSFLKLSGPCQQDLRRVPGLAFFSLWLLDVEHYRWSTTLQVRVFTIFQACLERCNSKQLSLRL